MIDCKLLSGTQENPVKVVVDASAAFATICWAYEVTIGQETCLSCTTVGNESSVVEIEPFTDCTKDPTPIVGKIKWCNLEVNYEILHKKPKCDE